MRLHIGEGNCPPPTLEINSGKFEIIWALNFCEDPFLKKKTTLILGEKGGNFSIFGYILVRIIRQIYRAQPPPPPLGKKNKTGFSPPPPPPPPPKLLCSPTAMRPHPLYS